MRILVIITYITLLWPYSYTVLLINIAFWSLIYCKEAPTSSTSLDLFYRNMLLSKIYYNNNYTLS